jgi:hypothetical protein
MVAQSTLPVLRRRVANVSAGEIRITFFEQQPAENEPETAHEILTDQTGELGFNVLWSYVEATATYRKLR